MLGLLAWEQTAVARITVERTELENTCWIVG